MTRVVIIMYVEWDVHNSFKVICYLLQFTRWLICLPELRRNVSSLLAFFTMVYDLWICPRPPPTFFFAQKTKTVTVNLIASIIVLSLYFNVNGTRVWFWSMRFIFVGFTFQLADYRFEIDSFNIIGRSYGTWLNLEWKFLFVINND